MYLVERSCIIATNIVAGQRWFKIESLAPLSLWEAIQDSTPRLSQKEKHFLIL